MRITARRIRNIFDGLSQLWTSALETSFIFCELSDELSRCALKVLLDGSALRFKAKSGIDLLSRGDAVIGYILARAQSASSQDASPRANARLAMYGTKDVRG
jgi:hypothetical protein